MFRAPRKTHGHTGQMAMSTKASKGSKAKAADEPSFASKRRCLQRQVTVDERLANERIEVCSNRVLSASKFLDGTLLNDLAKEHAAEFDKLVFASRPNTFVGRRTWGSLCSGSEGAHFAMEAVTAAWPDVELEQAFACEVASAKRSWINNVVNAQRTAAGQRLVCIFKDILHMKGQKAECEVHGRMCPVPGCDILIVGTSCKDAKTRRTASGQSSSAQTWVHEHQRLYADMRLSFGAPSPHAATRSSPWWNTLSACQQSTIVYLQQKELSRTCHTTVDDKCRDLLIQIDQSAFRAPTSVTDGVTVSAPCILPGMMAWLAIPSSRGAERLLLGQEALMMQGYPVRRVQKALIETVSDRFMFDLAGNAMTTQVTLAVVQSAVASLTWKRKEEQEAASTTRDVDEAVFLLDLLRKD